MVEALVAQATSFGGDWTSEKLEILEKYLDAYTTALKHQRFRLIYIDAFAGSGTVDLGSGGPAVENLIRGSAEGAIGIGNKPFDHLVFVDKDPISCCELGHLKARYPMHSVQIEQADANSFLQGLDMNWRNWDMHLTPHPLYIVVRVIRF